MEKLHKRNVNPKWVIEDGAMKFERGGGDIMTKKQYENFDFRMEWKISEAGNSGIFVLADEKGKRIYSHAPEIQILDNEKHGDRKLPNHRSGSLYDMITAPAESQKKAGEWNQVHIYSTRVTCKFGKMTFKLWTSWSIPMNGRSSLPIANSKTGRASLKTKGHLGLQDHQMLFGSKTSKFWAEVICWRPFQKPHWASASALRCSG